MAPSLVPLGLCTHCFLCLEHNLSSPSMYSVFIKHLLYVRNCVSSSIKVNKTEPKIPPCFHQVCSCFRWNFHSRITPLTSHECFPLTPLLCNPQTCPSHQGSSLSFWPNTPWKGLWGSPLFPRMGHPPQILLQLAAPTGPFLPRR